ncbi:hypothetical protein PVAND_008585 [Polypedilum vanderplanki]|uniref:Peptidase S1 domain-containing protein n=1 Tax=Polypedilum vanderplanki TaxID=319348 RepID=A0A9J6CA81_POLVA|nr:hypothetical protein PVAND_008585 [Polypedilum vanderplanki]
MFFLKLFFIFICLIQTIVSSPIKFEKEIVKERLPWVAKIYFEKNYICEASLISNEFLLTVAHCFPKNQMDEESLKNYHIKFEFFYKNEKIAIKRNISQIIIHKSYSRTSTTKVNAFNIALIKIDHKIVFNEYINAIQLPSYGNFTVTKINGYFISHDVTKDDLITQSKLETIEYKECLRKKILTMRKELSLWSFCALESSKNIINYPGSAYYFNNTIYGIRTQKPSIDGILSYLKVSFYVNWITETIDRESTKEEIEIDDGSDFKIKIMTKSYKCFASVYCFYFT